MNNLMQFSKEKLQEYQLCFIHLPKTGGTTFTNLIESFLGRDQVLQISPQIIHGRQDPDFDINDYECITGHFSCEIYKLMRRRPLFMTFLREPLRRSISQFRQYQRVDLNSPYFLKHKDFSIFENMHSISFDEFIHHADFEDAVINLQTRMLGLSIQTPVTKLSDLPATRTNDRTYSLNLAKERLEQFMFLGLQEEFQKSMDFFYYQFSIFPFGETPVLNVSHKKTDLDDFPASSLDYLRELNKLDIELYEYGVKLFNERYQSLIDNLKATYPDEILTTRRRLELSYWDQKDLPRSIEYYLGSINSRSGWYPVEQVDGNRWMWSGPVTISTIDFPIDRSENLQISLLIRNAIDLDILNTLELRCEGQPVILSYIVVEEGYLFTGIIPANPKNKYLLTRFSINLERTVYPPGMTAETPGARLLGVALSWIRFKPIA